VSLLQNIIAFLESQPIQSIHTTDIIKNAVNSEMFRILGIYPRVFDSDYEVYAVILEKLDDFWDSVKDKKPDPAKLVQVAACSILAAAFLVERVKCDQKSQEG
jgi:hypothetical protein